MQALPGEILDAVLDRMPVARLAVTAADGRPEAMPIVFARHGTTLASPVDGKPKSSARLKRLDAISKQPNVGLVLDHYSSDWQQLWWIKLDVRATVGDSTHSDFVDFERALARKYPQYGDTAMFLGEPTLVVMTIERTRWWASTGLAGVEQWLREDTDAR